MEKFFLKFLFAAASFPSFFCFCFCFFNLVYIFTEPSPMEVDTFFFFSSKAGCSSTAWNSWVPLKQFVRGRYPFLASSLKKNSRGHFLYALFSPWTQSISTKNLVHTFLFFVQIFFRMLYPYRPLLYADHNLSTVCKSATGMSFTSVK